MVECITKISKEVLGEMRGDGFLSKDTWWWNEEVQAANNLGSGKRA